MATLDLSEISTDETTAALDATPAALAPAPRQALSNVTGVSGDISTDDVRLPRINLLQKMSGLVDQGFSPGDYVYAKEVRWIPSGGAADITFLNIERRYQQRLPYDSEERPAVYNTKEEVLAAGGSLQYGSANEFQPIAHLTCLIEAPDGLTDEQEAFFPFSFGDKLYALAKWTVTSTAYTNVATPLISAAALFLRDGLHIMKYSLSAEKRSKGNNTWFVPKLKSAGKHTPEFVEFASQFKLA